MSDAADGFLGDYLPHKKTCRCEECSSERTISVLRSENATLKAALIQAAMSLETIDEQAGRDECLKSMTQVRGYAHNRSTVARAALAPPQEAPRG